MEKKCKICGTTEKVNFDEMCKRCYEDSIVIHEEIGTNNNCKNEKSFWKDKKNIAIMVLSFLLFCCLCSTNSTRVNELSGKLKESNAKITKLDEKLNDSKTQIASLQTENKKLQGNEAKITELQTAKTALEVEKGNLEQEKASLETQNQELNARVEELQKVSSNKTTTSQTSNSAVATGSTPATVSSTTTNSKVVYITNTGKKYHSSGCSYLKNSKHEIGKDDAVAQGYTACSRCNP